MKMSMKISYLILLISSFFSISSFSSVSSHKFNLNDSIQLEKLDLEQYKYELVINKTDTTFYRKPKKWVAALLCLSLGPFGMHRLYLGTRPEVAAAYSVTLGGVGTLAIIDLFVITFTKDITQFYNNPKVIMWRKE